MNEKQAERIIELLERIVSQNNEGLAFHYAHEAYRKIEIARKQAHYNLDKDLMAPPK